MKRIIAIVLVLLTVAVQAQDIKSIIRNKPNPPKLVNDYADILSPSEEQQLERKLVAYDDTTSTQIAIVIVKTLEGRDVEGTAVDLFRSWGIGNAKTNNGVLILVSKDDRQIRIETGYGLEGAIPDITANQIIRNDIQPAFRSEDYYAGLDKATQSLIQAAKGEYKAPQGYNKRGKRSTGLGGGIIGFIVIVIVLSIFRRGGGGGGGGYMSRRGAGDVLTPFLLGSLLGGGGRGGGGGSGWSGGGGGGFGGFGGGSSGGGGASGSW